ncbi:hypothetical protein B0H13DRAFT_1879589 [Mycena leptocephala]|nr:hypothetical protein B0H13DRAFT_1879589 [Mycena leptocephala]
MDHNQELPYQGQSPHHAPEMQYSADYNGAPPSQSAQYAQMQQQTHYNGAPPSQSAQYAQMQQATHYNGSPPSQSVQYQTQQPTHYNGALPSQSAQYTQMQQATHYNGSPPSQSTQYQTQQPTHYDGAQSAQYQTQQPTHYNGAPPSQSTQYQTQQPTHYNGAPPSQSTQYQTQQPTHYNGAPPSQSAQYAQMQQPTHYNGAPPSEFTQYAQMQQPTHYNGAPPSQFAQYAQMQQPTHYNGTLPSQSAHYASSQGNSLHAPRFQPQSRPLPAPVNPHFGNFTPPVTPQPLLPMTVYIPGVSSSPFVQPIGRSESSRSSESVYGTPPQSFSPGPGTPQLTPAQWPQQAGDLEMSGDNTPAQMADEEQSWSGESLYNIHTQPSHRDLTTPTQHDHNQMSQGMEDGEGYRRKVPSCSSARNGDNQTGGVPYVAQPTPGPSTTERHPRIEFQNKVRVVGNQSTEAYRGLQQELKNERRGRREAEKGAREKQNEAAEQLRQLKAAAEQKITLLSTFEMEANERDRKAQELQAKKRQEEYEMSLASLSQRLAIKGTPLPPRQQPDFPDTPLVLTPRYVPQTTCQQRQLDTINRNAGGNLPHLRQVKRENDSADDHRNNSSNSSETETESEDDGVSRKGKGAGKGKSLVKELMKEMKVGGVTKSKSRRKVCRATGLDQAKKMQQDKLTKEEDMNCKALVHELFRLSTQLNRAADFKDYRPATDDQAAHCGDPNGERLLPGVSPFYFGKGYKTCMWNNILLRGLVGDLQRKRAEDPNHWNIPDVSTDYLISLFLNSIKEGRYTCVWQQPRLGESEAQAQARAEQYDKATKQAKSSRSRKEMKWKRRCRTAKKMKLLCAGDPTAVKIWAWVKKLLALLGTLGMSSEDAKPHKTITDTLELVDFAADQISLKKGLPETLYDEQWMADGLEMDPDFMTDLNVSEEAFEIMELAFEDLGIEVVEEEEVEAA